MNEEDQGKVEDGLIEVRDDLIQSSLVMGLRQAVLAIAPLVFTNAMANDAIVEAICAAAAFLLSFGYGQWRHRQNQKRAIKLAIDAPRGRVVP